MGQDAHTDLSDIESLLFYLAGLPDEKAEIALSYLPKLIESRDGSSQLFHPEPCRPTG